MLTNANLAQATYGLVTNDSSFAFLKMLQVPQPRYEISDVMLLLPGRNRLHHVLQVMKLLKQIIKP